MNKCLKGYQKYMYYNSKLIKIYITHDHTNNYIANNPVLSAKVLAFEYNDDGPVGYKLGDGVSKWSELNYIERLIDLDEFVVFNRDKNSNEFPAAKIILKPFINLEARN